MNQLLSDIKPASLVLTAIILIVAGLLGSREWIERSARPNALTPSDFDHLTRRDRRRSLGLSILCILAIGVVVGSRVPLRTTGGRPSLAFVVVWLAEIGLLLTLLLLAALDWFDLRRYAKRKRSAMDREHLATLRDELRRLNDTDDR